MLYAPTRRMSLQAALFGGGWLALTLLSTTPAFAEPRYYIRLRDVELATSAGGTPPAPTPSPEAAGAAAASAATAAPEGAGLSSDAIAKMARENLLDALRKRSEVILELDGVAADAPAARYAEELKRRKLKGYEVTLRILKLERSVKPPPAGGKFRLLERDVKLSLVGTLFPGEPQLALGGDGESTVQIEVGKQISENQERDVLSDVLKDAVDQAVTQALRKLQIGPMKPPKDPPRRRK